MRKAPDAFRTISEAADLLDTPAHVLRFWESKFPQIKPVKRAGGRRYYRRVDIDLLSGIKLLLHDQGMTIRGVQKLLAEKGPRHVAELSPFPEDVFDGDVIDAIALSEDATLDEEDVALDAAVVVAEDSPDTAAPPVQDAEQPSMVPDNAPQSAPPPLPEPTQNAFAEMGRVPIAPAPKPKAAPKLPEPPAPRAPLQAAQIAHALRSHPPAQIDRARLAQAVAGLERLLARMAAQSRRDRAR